MGEKREEEKKEEGRDRDKKGGGFSGRVRMGIGILIILMGLLVCLYPFYRQKKSDNFNQDAINMILTPQPEKPEDSPTPTVFATKAPDDLEEEPTPTGEAADSGQPTEEDAGLLFEDLIENPDAPDVQEELSEGEEEENANRLGGKKVIGVIQIPKIELIYAIVEGADAAEIGVAIGHMDGTAKLGEIGNCALAGHRGGYSGPYFKNLDKLELGDDVVITDTDHKVYTYKVTETMIVEPEEVWVVEDTGEGVAMLTLVTCENSGEQRLIVRCVVK